MPGVLGSLQEAGNEGRLERAEEPRIRVQFRNLALVRAQPRMDLALPFGMLDFQRVQGGEQGVCFTRAAGNAGPAPDVFVGRRLAPVLQL